MSAVHDCLNIETGLRARVDGLFYKRNMVFQLCVDWAKDMCVCDFCQGFYLATELRATQYVTQTCCPAGLRRYARSGADMYDVFETICGI